MKYLSLILILSLQSCRGIPPAKFIDVERCFPSFEESTVIEETPFYSGVCRCHTYRIGIEIKRTSESTDKPLNYCDKMAGFPNYATGLYLYLEEWRVYLYQQKQFKRFLQNN